MLLSDDKYKRKFTRYSDQSICEIKIDDTVYKGIVVDFSDGLGVIIEKAPDIKKGTFAEIIIHNSGSEMRGQVAWVKEMGSDARVGFKRVGNLKGNLNDYNLADLLIGIQRGTNTGILQVASGSVVKQVYIKNGDMIFSSSNSEDDRLGELLLSEGKITVEQFDRASERLLETGEKLGKILVDMSCMSPKELFQATKRQIEEIILRLFAIEDGAFEFREGPFTSNDLITLRISAANIIYKGMKRIKSFTKIQQICPSTEAVLTLSQNPIDIFQSISLDPEDKQILYLIQGSYPLKTILKLSPLPDFETLKTISAFLRIGTITMKNEEKDPGVVDVCDVLTIQGNENQDEFQKDVEKLYAKSGSADYYEFLGVERTAEGEKIQKAYYRISKQFHPDRHFSFPKLDIKGKLIKIFAYATEADTVLSDPEKKGKYDQSLLHNARGILSREGKGHISYNSADAPEIPMQGAAEGHMDVFINDFQESAVPETGEEPETHHELGEAYREMGLVEDAIKEFRIASRDPSKRINCGRAIAGCYVEEGQYQNAIEELKELASMLAAGTEDYLEVKYELADIYVKNNDHDNALKLYGEIQLQNIGYRDVAGKIEALGRMQSFEGLNP